MTWDTSMIRTPPSNRLVASVDMVSVSDNFNRADGALGPNWFGPDGLNPPNVNISTLRAHGTGAAQNRATWGAPAGLAGTDLSSAGSQCGVSMRFRGTANAAARMQLSIDHTTDLSLMFFRISLAAGIWTARGPIVSAVIPAPADGDVLTLRQFGAVMKGYINGALIITDNGPWDQDALVHASFTLNTDTYADNFSFFTSQPVIL
jgi:hypothetical protein